MRRENSFPLDIDCGSWQMILLQEDEHRQLTVQDSPGQQRKCNPDRPTRRIVTCHDSLHDSLDAHRVVEEVGGIIFALYARQPAHIVSVV